MKRINKLFGVTLALLSLFALASCDKGNNGNSIGLNESKELGVYEILSKNVTPSISTETVKTSISSTYGVVYYGEIDDTLFLYKELDAAGDVKSNLLVYNVKTGKRVIAIPNFDYYLTVNSSYVGYIEIISSDNLK